MNYGVDLQNSNVQIELWNLSRKLKTVDLGSTDDVTDQVRVKVLGDLSYYQVWSRTTTVANENE